MNRLSIKPTNYILSEAVLKDFERFWFDVREYSGKKVSRSCLVEHAIGYMLDNFKPSDIANQVTIKKGNK